MRLTKIMAAMLLAAAGQAMAQAGSVPAALQEAAKTIQGQSCADCTLDTTAQLKALQKVEQYLAGQSTQAAAAVNSANKEAHLLNVQAHIDLALLHYAKQEQNKSRHLQEAQKILGKLFAQYPQDARVVEKFVQFGAANELEKTRGYAALAQLKPQDADTRFFLGYYRLRNHQADFRRELSMGIKLQQAPGRIQDYFQLLQESLQVAKCAEAVRFDALAAQLQLALKGVEGDAEGLPPAMRDFKKQLLSQVDKLQCAARTQ